MPSIALLVLKLLVVWGALLVVLLLVWNTFWLGSPQEPLAAVWFALLLPLLWRAREHIVNVVRIVGRGNLSSSALANRHHRVLESPLPPKDMFELCASIIKASRDITSADADPDRRVIDARAIQPNAHMKRSAAARTFLTALNEDRVLIRVSGDDESSVATVECEPVHGAWLDWLVFDRGENLERIHRVSDTIMRRISELQRAERAESLQASKDKALALAKLSLLEAQIEPHFLYNTLGSARHLVRKDPDTAEKIIDRLVVYLRDSLSGLPQHTRSLGEELQGVSAYLDIQQIRLGERLQCQIDVIDELRAIHVPTMAIQTLVENAIKHGIEPKPEGGHVWIVASKNNQAIQITVADDGVGITAGSNPANAGTGLRNVRERIKLLYGQSAELAVSDNFPSGVAVSLRLPMAEANVTNDERR